ncbi:MAG TPA: DNA repair protein RadA, partial [Gammaproteobacteria bacterium]|nr:DNA repair protein RadA [Gammaproteobacteria bacterium]
MSRTRPVFACTECGTQAPKWTGRCPDCGAWNTLVEAVVPSPPSRNPRFAGYAGRPGRAQVQALADVAPEQQARLATGIGELDRVLGGGLVPGSVVLIGGDPGIGKSTLLLQALAALPPETSSLYVSGEESPQQVSLRARRLGLNPAHLRLLAETRVEDLLAAVDRERPRVLVVDSIQTVYTDLLQSAPGSVAQVRESAAQLVRYAKQSGTVVFLVG